MSIGEEQTGRFKFLTRFTYKSIIVENSLSKCVSILDRCSNVTFELDTSFEDYYIYIRKLGRKHVNDRYSVMFPK